MLTFYLRKAKFAKAPSDGGETMRVTGRASYPRHPLGRGEVGTGQTDIALCGAVQVSNRIDFGG